MELNNGAPPWLEFVRLVNMRIGPPTTDTPLGELAQLHRTGTGDDICGRFMALSCHDHMLTESQQIQLFTTGQGEPLRTDVALWQPTSLDAAVMFVRAYEQWLAALSAPAPTSKQASRSASKP
jgi:hypothetical protein